MKFFFSPNFTPGFLLIFKQGFISDLKSKSLDFGFIRFLILSAFCGYLIRKILSSVDPSI